MGAACTQLSGSGANYEICDTGGLKGASAGVLKSCGLSFPQCCEGVPGIAQRELKLFCDNPNEREDFIELLCLAAERLKELCKAGRSALPTKFVYCKINATA